MSEEPAAVGSADVRFSERDLEVLRDIVADWLEAQLVIPPYPDDVVSVIGKLGVADEIADARGETALTPNMG